MSKRRINIATNSSPFANWLIEQIESRQTTMAGLGRQAGLSTGTLRCIITTPGRQPTVDTCLRLARALNVSYEEVLKVAGLSPSLPSDLAVLDPDRVEFLRLYDTLPSPARRTLLDTTRTISHYLNSVARREEKDYGCPSSLSAL
ncbi:MAG: hypothetical protein JW850_08800 [Thermoflexales bacterium]|nr:hypothetical protein [Thermoflexales bacterium]